MAKNDVSKLEELKAKALEEYKKVNDYRRNLKEKREALRKQKTIMLNGQNREKMLLNIDLDNTTPTIPKSPERIQDEIVSIDKVLKADQFAYEEYRKATKEYINALEPVFDEMWNPILEEKNRIKEARKQLDEEEEKLLDRERDVDIQLDEMLIEVGCNSCVFPIDHGSYTNRRLFLRKIERFENEASE